MKKIPSMIYPFTFLLSIACVSGCSISSSPKLEKNKMELTLHKVRADLEEVKHDLNTYEIEYHVLEGKLMNQDVVIKALKQTAIEAQQSKLDQFAQEIANIERKTFQISKQQEKITTDIRQLSTHANETTTALSQYKEKIAQVEHNMNIQNQQVNEFIHLKNTPKGFVPSILSSNQNGADSNSNVYVVKSGDTLRKIAENYHTTSQKLQELNNLINDRIYIGQELNTTKQ